MTTWLQIGIWDKSFQIRYYIFLGFKGLTIFVNIFERLNLFIIESSKCVSVTFMVSHFAAPWLDRYICKWHGSNLKAHYALLKMGFWMLRFYIYKCFRSLIFQVDRFVRSFFFLLFYHKKARQGIGFKNYFTAMFSIFYHKPVFWTLFSWP